MSITKQAITQKRQSITSIVNEKKAEINKVIPAHLKGQGLLETAMFSIRDTPALLECTVPSLVGALHRCMQFGLSPNTALGHVYLIPFWNNKKECKEVQVILGYRGLITLAENNSNITLWHPHEIKQNDQYEIEYGTQQRLRHTPNLTGDRGPTIAYYSVCERSNGARDFRLMTVEEVERVRSFSKQRDSVPWTQHFDAMGMKTVMRQHAKYLPLTTQAQEFISVDDAGYQGAEQRNEDVIDITPEPSFEDQDSQPPPDPSPEQSDSPEDQS